MCPSAWMLSAASVWVRRSEEHTSELQSPCNLVCRLLLEKKKQQTRTSSTSLTAHTISVPNFVHTACNHTVSHFSHYSCNSPFVIGITSTYHIVLRAGGYHVSP